MTTLEIPAPAKINLWLLITGRREDGYHQLQTLFQLLDYGDTLRFESSDDASLSFSHDMPGLDDQDNLVVKAATLLRETTGCRAGAHIRLNKRLPAGGGVGGGSSDAATTLLALNKLWRTGLNLDELATLGLQLGADVPVFVHGKTAWAEGVGEQLTPVNTPPFWYTVIKPACSVSTGAIFSHPELTRNSSPIKIRGFLEPGARNDCEALVCRLYPEVSEAIERLSLYAPARLTGTGACVFAAFDTRGEAQAALDGIRPQLTGFVARGVCDSPAHQALGLV